MKLPRLDLIQLVGTRLGFGKVVPKASPAPAQVIVEESDIAVMEPEPPNPDWIMAQAPKALESLAIEVSNQPSAPPPPAIESDTPDVGFLLAQLSRSASFHEPQAAESKPATIRVFAIGFPAAQKIRIQQAIGRNFDATLDFVTLDTISERQQDASSADLLLINMTSVTVVQRIHLQLIELLSFGRPTLLVGSRAALKQLGGHTGASENWDFIPVPWDPDEFIWRSRRLLQNKSAEAPMAAPAPRARKSKPVAPKTGLKQIVVADHDPVSRALVESTLAVSGMIAVDAAGDGDAALERIRETRPDVLVMDLSLPNRDGFQLLADLKRNPELKQTKIVVLSARQAEVDILRAFGLGADDYVTKPFSPLELRARVKRLLPEEEAE